MTILDAYIGKTPRLARTRVGWLQRKVKVAMREALLKALRMEESIASEFERDAIGFDASIVERTLRDEQWDDG